MGEKHKYVARYLFWSTVAIAGVFCVTGLILGIEWPFRQKEIVRDLEELSKCKVRITRFHDFYFPFPGYAAEGVTFTRPSSAGSVRMGSVAMLRARSSWLALLTFTHRIKTLEIQGLRVEIPAPVPPPVKYPQTSKVETTVTSLMASGAVLEIAPRNAGDQPVPFSFPQLNLQNVQKGKSIAIQTVVELPEPRGELAVTGRFGPFREKALEKAPLFGSFALKHADLGVFHTIAGILDGHGDLHGTLGQCDVRGTASIPDFEVTSSGHATRLNTDFDALVDGIHGTVAIQSLRGSLPHTTLLAHGYIGPERGEKDDTVTLEVRTEGARIEDLLWIFAKSNPPAMRGPLSFQTTVTLPPGREKFLRRVCLQGEFAIHNAEFTHVNTQDKLDELSRRARKDKDDVPEQNVSSSLKGDVVLRNGTATLSQLVFTTPGAKAQGEGRYDLLTEGIDLQGKLAMQASLSKAAGGVKSFLLLPLDPFFKKRGAGAVLPIHITGTYSHPSFRVSLTGKK